MLTKLSQDGRRLLNRMAIMYFLAKCELIMHITMASCAMMSCLIHVFNSFSSSSVSFSL